VTSYGTNTLYHNNGDGTFSDRSVASHIAGPTGFWTGASWGDYNRDGFLDLYITGYVKYSRPEATGSGHYDIENPASINPSAFRAERNLLYRNNGNGTFTEVAKSAGVADTAGRSLSAAWVDFDEDGWPDLYVANDQSENAFFRNLGNGTFENLSHAAHVDDYRSSMGIAIGDWDGDGDQDMFLTHWIAQENALYTNLLAQMRRGLAPSGGAPVTFTDEADKNGLGQSSLDFVGWGTSFIDYDNDGKLDLFIVNGSTLQSRDDSTKLVPMKNQLFWNRGAKQGFYDVSVVGGPSFRDLHDGRGAAFADYDNDGDVDVFVVNNGGAGMLLRNEGGNRNHWLQVEVRGTKSNRQGIGATVRVVAGGASYKRQVGAQSSYLSQNSLVETFGLGTLTKADSIEVTWPSGARDVRTDVASNQRLVIIEGEAPAVDRTRVQDFWTVYREATSLRIAHNPQRAAERYERALELNPNHEDALYYLGSMRLALRDFAGAARAWRSLLSVNPSSARTQSQLGALHMCLDAGAPFQLDSAERHLRRAHEINREENGPLVRMGEVALMRGDVQAARRLFETVLATDAANGPAHFYTGYIALRSNKAVVALEEFRRAAPAVGAAAPAVAGEGDTKHGPSAPVAGEDACGALRALSRGIQPTGDEREMAKRYGALDGLLRRARDR
jgi:tetratricopeptide (TPR) repeat protein